ncbi:HAMP domain-containing sensor histidine kinase [Novosphingobium sp. BL-8H]|uniref:sensor histidine kinase n=1 Tax=Novosphingobium sp. BL-8H TaxID=3127640 RepID=UPI003757750B
MLFIGALAAVLAVGLAAAAAVGWLTQRRLSRIDTAAQAIIAGDLGRRIVRDGSGSEFDRLAETLNRMLDRIEGLMDNLRQVSGDIAHDLRTPLTRLYGSLDRAADEADGAVRSDLIAKARAQASELLEIFAALLRITEIEGLSERLARPRIDLSALLRQMAETYAPDFEDSGRTLHWVIPPDLHVHGDRRLLSQAVANLLDNALRHTPKGTVVELAAKVERGAGRDELVLLVSDDGPGVAEEDRTRLFRRFARADRARSTEGHGLGLSMVQAIANAHGGAARILPAGSGCAVELRMPASPGEDEAVAP